MLSFCKRIIEYSFYNLFFFVPLIFLGNTSELFEFNKMWLTFGLTVIIAAAWGTKMILQKRFSVQRTPLDIPILLFLSSQVISTIFSLDPYLSWWGYYSRWNGGLLSTISYILLYYAFVSNLEAKHVLRGLSVSLLSGLVVGLWGFPAHFGYDPTCWAFRGTLDTNCWTEAFKPTIRTFSTLGQPAWEAAYMALLLPIAFVFGIQYLSNKKTNDKKYLHTTYYILLATLFYVSLTFSNTRAGFIGFFVADILLWLAILYKRLFSWKKFFTYFVTLHSILFLTNFFFGMPHSSLSKLTFQELTKHSAATVNNTPETPKSTQSPQLAPQPNILITDSADIRKNVWAGAIEAWKNNPIFGTGVETYAFAYYRYKSPEHNLTSEWDYLYNKAHNEYLNYLATTGTFGLGTYLAFIGLFIFLFIKYLISNIETRNTKQTQNLNDKNLKRFEHSSSKNSNLFRVSDFGFRILTLGLFAGWISILITNFFGFSVVIMNLYLFLIPAFFFILTDTLKHSSAKLSPLNSHLSTHVNPYQWTGIGALLLASCSLLFSLFSYWSADIDYALGSNLDRVGQYQQGYPHLLRAVTAKPNEPVYADELSQNLGVLASALAQQKDTNNAETVAKNAIELNNEVIQNHPNNVVFWKNRVRLFYTLSQSDLANKQNYFIEAVNAIDKAQTLAPNDAKIAYNQGVMHGQAGEIQKGVEILKRAIVLKPNYRDAYYALALFYHQLAVDKDEKVIEPEMQKKAVETMKYVLTNLSPDDKQVKETLKQWEK